MRSRSFGEASLFPGDYSVFLILLLGLPTKWYFFFVKASACLKCSEPRPHCFISQAVTNSSEVLWLGLNMGNNVVQLHWYSFYIQTNSSRMHSLLPEGCSMLIVPAHFVYSQGLYNIALVLFMSKCIRHDIWDMLECWILALLWQNLAAAQNNFVPQQEAKWARTPCLAATEVRRGGEFMEAGGNCTHQIWVRMLELLYLFCYGKWSSANTTG